MEIQDDFSELLASLNVERVEYLIVGGYAVAHHGAPRYTGDIDIYVNPTAENAQRVLKGLSRFGFGDAGLSTEDFTRLDTVVQLGVPPVRVDILTSISGVGWDRCWSGKEAGSYGDVSVFFIGKRELLENKRCTGRYKDLADIEALDEQP